MLYGRRIFGGLGGFLLGAGLLAAQHLAIRASTPPDWAANIRIDPLSRTPDLLIIAAQDALRPSDLPELRKFVNTVFRATHDVADVRFAILSHGALIALRGPFNDAAELQSALKGLSTEASSPDSNVLPGLITSLSAIPSQWGYAAVLAHAPHSDRYSSAWTISNLMAQKRSLIWWDPAGTGAAGEVLSLTTNSGGAVVENGDQLARIITDPGQLFGVTWNYPGPSRGFELRDQQVPGFGNQPLLFSRTPVIPSIAEYAELRDKVRRADELLKAGGGDLKEAQACIERALAINPADMPALTLGIDLWDRLKDRKRQISLLQLATELSPNDASFWTKLGNQEYEESEFDTAEPALLRARELGVQSPLISDHLGRIRLKRKDLSQAVEYLDDSLRQNDRQQELWYLTSDISKQLGRPDKQAASLEHALSLGDDLRRHMELIDLYFSKGDTKNAALHADLELSRIPQDPDTQTVWAGYFERLSRPDDALACWKRVAAADPKREPAHYAIASIYLSKAKWTDALDASENAFAVGVESARLELVKTTALEKMDRIYEARGDIADYVKRDSDVEILRRAAELADIYGGDAPGAYRAYVEQLVKADAPKDELQGAARRGQRVSIREGDAKAAAWFAQISSPLAGTGPSAPPPNGVWIPGGLEALAFVAQGQSGGAPDRFLTEYCRTILAHESARESKEAILYRKSIASYFSRLRDLLALAPPKENKSVLTLSIRDKRAQSQTEAVLNIFGWKMRRVNNKIVIQSSEKAGEAEKQDLASALAIDQAGMQTAFQDGKSFTMEIPFEWVPVRLGEQTWRSTLQLQKYSGGMAEALSQEPSFARAYLGLSNVDTATAEILAFRIGLPTVAAKYSDLLALYSGALATTGGHVVVPGGSSAEPLWARLVGADPANPADFFRALFEKDEGKTLAWFSALSGLDLAHQQFFTASTNRLNSFYQAFTGSADMQVGAARLAQGASFGQFLREVPLDEGHVSFPGAPEVWMIAKGVSTSQNRSDKMLRKVRRVAAPEIEDQILLRLAHTKFKSAGLSGSELDNFLAVVRIDAARDESLDADSALLLAQNYNEFASFYPYFGVFRSLTSADFRQLFGLLEKLKSLDPVEGDIVLGQFEALIEIIKLCQDFGRVAPDQAILDLRALCSKYVATSDLAGYASAALDVVRLMTKNDADADLEALILGKIPAIEFEWNGSVHSIDAGKNRSIEYQRVLELQKAPSLNALLQMDQAIRQIAGGKGNYGPALDNLQKNFTSLPTVEIPKSLKFIGTSHQSILRNNPAKIGQVISELRQKTAKKNVNVNDLQKQGREVLELMAPQVRLALTGVIYGAYLRPDDILTANDPLLLRKQQAFDLRAELSRKTKFPNSALDQSSSGEGSVFIGGFGEFAAAAARAADIKPGANEALYTNQIAAVRMTPWTRYSENDQLAVGLRIRAVREWCVQAAEKPTLMADLAADTAGLLSLNRRRELLNGLTEKKWDTLWQSVTLSDLLLLSERYLARYHEGQIDSPVDAALRQAEKRSSDESVDLLGPIAVTLNLSNEPRLTAMAPYEEYQRHLFPSEIAERTSEMKIYLSYALDKYSLPPAVIPAIIDPVMKRAFSSMRMSDPRDWEGAIKAFETIDANVIGAAMENRK